LIGLDTNVLVRYATMDDPVQSPRSVVILEQELTPEYPGFVSTVVLAELAWVLRRSYGLSWLKVAALMEELLAADRLVIEHATAVYRAAVATREQGADFADGLIAAIAATAGCERTLTFDRSALRVKGFAAA
jgi:predicted nucleic-acid-binding protein